MASPPQSAIEGAVNLGPMHDVFVRHKCALLSSTYTERVLSVAAGVSHGNVEKY